MDQEIAALKLNINQLAGITGVHRQTVATRLKNIEPAPGSNSKLKLYLVTDTGQLIPADEVAREFSLMAKAVVMVLETLPDVLERDCALTPSAVARVQSVIDDLRDQMAERVQDAEAEEDEPEED